MKDFFCLPLQSQHRTCWEAGTGCTTGAWADDDVRSAATLVVVSEPPSEFCMLGWTHEEEEGRK